MKYTKDTLKEFIRKELITTFKEGVYHGDYGMTVHPFDNELANQKPDMPMVNIQEEIADATIMEMMARYEEKEIRQIVRHFGEKATQGPGGIGGQLTNEQLEEIYLMVVEKVVDKTGVNLSSYEPQDREPAKYMDLD